MVRDVDTRRGDAGMFGPDSVAWRFDREALLLLGAGPRALLLQLAHPAVAAGVEEHSDFRADPWRRLDVTLRSYLRIIYGSTPAARDEIRRLNALHRGITGQGYDARDPALSMWVHATLVDSTIVAYDAWLETLSRERRERFYAETRPVARLFGVPEDTVPADLDAFEAYLAAATSPAGPVHPTDASRDIAWHILHPPFGPLHPAFAWIPRSASTWSFWPAVAALPAPVRAEYGLELGPVERAVAAWLVAAWRGWRPFLPATLRQMGAARAADRRILAE